MFECVERGVSSSNGFTSFHIRDEKRGDEEEEERRKETEICTLCDLCTFRYALLFCSKRCNKDKMFLTK